MEKIYSRVEPGVLLHIIHAMSDVVNQTAFREDLIPNDNFLQCSALKLKEGHTFKPHKHIFKQRTHYKQIAQESWCVIRGKIKCTLYDLDNSVIAERILFAGDASVTLRGGHNYLCMEDGSLIREYKTGPYEGQQFDKEFIV